MHPNFMLLDHPLIQHKITYLRNQNTGSKEFRELVGEVAMLICYEATRDLPLCDVEIQTPLTVTTCKVVSGRKLAFVPILRAGLGMVDAVLSLVPAAKVGHIGLYRDPETHLPVEYYCKLPADVAEREVIILEPMLATGGTLVDAVNLIKGYGVTSIKVMCVMAAQEGVDVLLGAHPDVKVYCGALDAELNADKYIVPGLGDAGDRIFGTK